MISSLGKLSRNQGIDVLRIGAMLMICVLHTLGKGGVLSSVNPGSAQDHVAWMLEIFCFCAVNCYALISGYLLFDRPFSFSRAIHLWMIIVFFTVSITLIMFATKQVPFDRTLLYDAFLPITRNQYWYLTAYFGVYLFSPFFNAAVKSLDEILVKKIFLVAFILLCVLPTFLGGDPFYLRGGYSMLWLGILYIVGASIKKYDSFINIPSSKCILLFFMALFVTYMAKLVLPPLFFAVWNVNNDGKMFISYTSPTMVVASIALFFLCKQMKINVKSCGLLSRFASASLSVYIIHTHPLIWNHYVLNFAQNFVSSTAVILALKVVVSALSIWFFCSLIDFIRQSIFKILRIGMLCKYVDRVIMKNEFNS